MFCNQGEGKPPRLREVLRGVTSHHARRTREVHEPGLWRFSARLLHGFVVSAKLGDTCWSFYRGEMTVSANLRKSSTKIARKNIQMLARKIPHIKLTSMIAGGPGRPLQRLARAAWPPRRLPRARDAARFAPALWLHALCCMLHLPYGGFYSVCDQGKRRHARRYRFGV